MDMTTGELLWDNKVYWYTGLNWGLWMFIMAPNTRDELYDTIQGYVLGDPIFNPNGIGWVEYKLVQNP